MTKRAKSRKRRNVARQSVGTQANGIDAFKVDQTGIVGEIVETGIDVRKPKEDEVFRVDPRPEYHPDFYLYREEVEGSFTKIHHLVSPAMAPHFTRAYSKKLTLCTIYVCTNSHGKRFLWPVPSIRHGGRNSSWHMSAHKIAQVAMEEQVTMFTADGRYNYRRKLKNVPLFDPRFEEAPSFSALCNLAWPEDRRITRADHPFIEMLQGETGA
jgi:hypothetical protein